MPATPGCPSAPGIPATPLPDRLGGRGASGCGQTGEHGRGGSFLEEGNLWIKATPGPAGAPLPGRGAPSASHGPCLSHTPQRPLAAASRSMQSTNTTSSRDLHGRRLSHSTEDAVSATGTSSLIGSAGGLPQTPYPDRHRQMASDDNQTLVSAIRAASEPRAVQNRVAQFFHDALRNSRDGAKLAKSRGMDLSRYWEKRRVQNALRRVLESLQERFGLEGNAKAGALGAVFDILVQHIRGCARGHQGACLAERELSLAFEVLGLWPQELSANDRSEVFTALLVPSTQAGIDVLSGKPMRSAVTRRLFCEGFDRVPFNLSDFPVPQHLLALSVQPGAERFTPEQVKAVAVAVASTFSMEHMGLGRVKDFFLSGLLSLEEIQAALPQLVPRGLVEDSVTRIIICGAPLLTAEEWSELVLNVRTREACGHQDEPATDSSAQAAQAAWLQAAAAATAIHAHQESSPVCLASPVLQPREVQQQQPQPQRQLHQLQQQHPPQQQRLQQLSMRHDVPQHHQAKVTSVSGSDEAADMVVSKFRGRFEPVTEPLPYRELTSEEPVRFARGSASNSQGGQVSSTVVNWGTASRARPPTDRSAPGTLNGAQQAAQQIAAHQADEGAGTRLSWGTSSFKMELASAASKSAGSEALGFREGAGALAASEGMDLLAWINLDLHHECAGPYLAHVFVRCCQLYEQRGAGRH